VVEREQQIKEITDKIIGCAIEVHWHLGPGLLEATYESAIGGKRNSSWGW
jgi:PD-(D/E)XK nuclease superfamily protein